jgi:hypothetical protein
MTANTILFMAANPTGTDARALAEQARAIQAELERAGHRDRFAFQTRWAAQDPNDLAVTVDDEAGVRGACDFDGAQTRATKRFQRSERKRRWSGIDGHGLPPEEINTSASATLSYNVQLSTSGL